MELHCTVLIKLEQMYKANYKINEIFKEFFKDSSKYLFFYKYFYYLLDCSNTSFLSVTDFTQTAHFRKLTTFKFCKWFPYIFPTLFFNTTQFLIVFFAKITRNIFHGFFIQIFYEFFFF